MLSLYYDGEECGTWLGIRAGHPFRAFIQVRGDISGVPRSTDWNRVTTSTDRYGSVYPCAVGSGGICIVRYVPARAVGGRGYATCILPFPALPLAPSILTAVPLLIESEAVRAYRELLFIPVLLLSSAYWF